jgi:hypothetical protein
MVTVPSAGASAGSTTCPGAWSPVNTPNVGAFDNRPLAVTVRAPGDAWLVGSRLDAGGFGHPLVQHWNGRRWSVVPTPAVGREDTALTGVVARARDDVWAVGRRVRPDQPMHSLIEHWDGQSWSEVPSPTVGSRDNALSSVTTAPDGRVWAAGFFIDAGGFQQPLVLRLTGSQFRVVPQPKISGSSNPLFGVAVGGRSVWAVGQRQGFTGPGRTLIIRAAPYARIVHSPNPGVDRNALAAVSAVSARSVWAVGTRLDGSRLRTLAEHYNGRGWSVVASASPGSLADYFDAVTAGGGRVWAAGATLSPAGRPHVLLECTTGASSPLSQVAGVAPAGTVTSLDLQADGSGFAVGFGPDAAGVDRALVLRHQP